MLFQQHGHILYNVFIDETNLKSNLSSQALYRHQSRPSIATTESLRTSLISHSGQNACYAEIISAVLTWENICSLLCWWLSGKAVVKVFPTQFFPTEKPNSSLIKPVIIGRSYVVPFFYGKFYFFQDYIKCLFSN